jgi:uncharacterized protein (TIGR03382 family)
MSYVDAGYAIALSVLALYSVALLLRRRRLERAVARGEAEEARRPGGTGGGDRVPARDAPSRDLARARDR